MTTDIFGRVLFSDGEAVDVDDLNDTSRRTLASLWDQLAYASLPRQAFSTSLDSAFTPSTSPYAFALTVFGARPIQGSANNKIAISEGTLMQAIGARNGSEPKLLAYEFPGTDEVTISNGSGANPRVDIVQMKLEYVEDTLTTRDFQDATTRALTSSSFNKRRRVKCTLSVKQGSASATPTYPIPDSGQVVIAGVLVGASYVGAAAFVISDSSSASAAVMHDQRLPIRIRPHGSVPVTWAYPNTHFDGLSAVGAMYVQRNAVAGSPTIDMPCPCWGNAGRLVEVDCCINGAAVETSRIITFTPGDVGAGATVIANANLAGGGTSTMVLERGGLFNFQTGHIAAAGPTIFAAGNGMGPPIWTNGRRAPGNRGTGELGSSTLPLAIAVRYVSPTAASLWTRVTFYVAEGM